MLVAICGAFALASGQGEAAAQADAAGDLGVMRAEPGQPTVRLAALAARPDRPLPGVAPVCMVASHDRLVLRSGRDICAPTLNRSGRPAAAGFLPTACPRSTEIYTIDAAGIADRCLNPVSKEN
ncbi:hypothetical protein [Erythrobacter tepidarius]|uniref:hypothetical protein n=1 Tax=Erythrobacter tepidarius TaxID=60454 RepID=UPI000A3AE78B|nr:hypothetical protein [Erythrobacter tepidarius]